jgi:hypothetical protein
MNDFYETWNECYAFRREIGSMRSLGYLCSCIRLFCPFIYILHHLGDFQGTYDVGYAIEVTQKIESIIS